MTKQSGVSTAGVALVIVLLGAAGGGFFAWQEHEALARAKTDLASARSALDKASAEMRAAQAEAAGARKALDEQKAALEQAVSERDSAKAFLESEKAHAARLQADIGLVREQLAYMRARATVPAQFSQPTLAPQPRPMVIQALPGARARGAAVAAPVPAIAR